MSGHWDSVLFGSAHRCPPWCHQCPDMRAAALERGDGEPIDPVWDQFMPGCMGGSVFGPDGCHCRPTGHLLTRLQAAEMRQQLREYDYAEGKRRARDAAMRKGLRLAPEPSPPRRRRSQRRSA